MIYRSHKRKLKENCAAETNLRTAWRCFGDHYCGSAIKIPENTTCLATEACTNIKAPGG